MKTSIIVCALSALVAASPIELANLENINLETREPVIPELQARQSGTTANEFLQGGCRDIIYIFARGSTEAGNLGGTVGPALADSLKRRYGSTRVAAQGVAYPALLSTNSLPGGCSPADATTMRNLITRAASQCPNSKIVAGGYSQGAAVTHRAVERLDAATSAKLVGVVTFGDTQNQQDRGRIPNFPTEKTRIICNTGDLVCQGTLVILAPHLLYEPRVPEASSFLQGRIGA